MEAVRARLLPVLTRRVTVHEHAFPHIWDMSGKVKVVTCDCWKRWWALARFLICQICSWLVVINKATHCLLLMLRLVVMCVCVWVWVFSLTYMYIIDYHISLYIQNTHTHTYIYIYIHMRLRYLPFSVHTLQVTKCQAGKPNLWPCKFASLGWSVLPWWHFNYQVVLNIFACINPPTSTNYECLVLLFREWEEFLLGTSKEVGSLGAFLQFPGAEAAIFWVAFLFLN